MTVIRMPEMKFKRKKNSRYRGSHTHGGGSKKKRRGAGHRGGRGNAGSGKRSDVKKQTYIVGGRRFGRFGFHNPTTKTVETINVGDLQTKIAKMKPQDSYDFDLGKLKIGKLLAKGDVKNKMTITVDSASAGAIKKVEAAGGTVTVLKPAVEKPVKVAPAKKK